MNWIVGYLYYHQNFKSRPLLDPIPWFIKFQCMYLNYLDMHPLSKNQDYMGIKFEYHFPFKLSYPNVNPQITAQFKNTEIIAA